jgi:hypothetical protein
MQGGGGFGVVFEARWRGMQVAVKKLPALGGEEQLTALKQQEALVREIRLSSKFQSER